MCKLLLAPVKGFAHNQLQSRRLHLATVMLLWPEQRYQFLCISGKFRFPDGLSGLPWYEHCKKYKGIGNIPKSFVLFEAFMRGQGTHGQI